MHNTQTMIQKKDQKVSFLKLPNNLLEKEIKAVVFSFNFPLNLFLTSKYSVRNNHIYPNGKKYQSIAFCRMFIMNVMTLYLMPHSTLSFSKTKRLVTFLVSVSVVIYFFINAIGFTTMFILDFMHRNNNIFLILNIQTIHRSIGSNNISSYVTWNWISSITIIFINVTIILMYYSAWVITDFASFIFGLICAIMLTLCDINIVIATRIIILLRKYLDDWTKNILMMNGEEENDEHCSKMFGIYQNILLAYNLFKIVFQLLVSQI